MSVAPPPINRFKRSSERKVTDPNELLTAERGREEYEELLRFEEIGFTAGAASVLVERVDVERAFRDDRLYDDFGEVR